MLFFFSSRRLSKRNVVFHIEYIGNTFIHHMSRGSTHITDMLEGSVYCLIYS